MPWLQLKCSTSQQHVDLISDHLSELGALSITYEDAEDKPILEPKPGETPLWDQLILTALFDAQCNTTGLLQRLNQPPWNERLQHPRFEQLEDKDWERAWMDSFHPMKFGQRLWIVPSWHEAPDANAVNILLDPGLAFGTGTHPTTSLCLDWLDSAELTNRSVLDYGCGSGILAIASAKLLAHQISAIDIDPQALIATRDNMQRNGIAANTIKVGMPDSIQGKTFDLVIANILAGPLKELSQDIARLVNQGGKLVLSGLLAEQEQEISQVYKKWFNMMPAVAKEDWIRLEGTKR